MGRPSDLAGAWGGAPRKKHDRARATALARFSTAKIIPQYERFYETVLARS